MQAQKKPEHNGSGSSISWNAF